MANEQAGKDDNAVSTLLGINNSDEVSTVKIWADPTTHRLLVDGVGATGPTGATGATGAVGHTGATAVAGIADAVYTPIVSITVSGGLITAIATA